MKGKYPFEYLKNPNIQKSVEEIWDDIDSYTGEFFEDDPVNLDRSDLFIPVPPLKYDGIFTKGILMTQCADYILDKYPKIKELFFVGAYTMWSSYSWCDRADLYFSCYENKPREAYHKNKYNNKKDIIFIPLQDADFTDENMMAPAYNTDKTHDIICVATPYEVKNHFIIAKAIKIYEEKYGLKLKSKFIFGTKDAKKDRRKCYDFSQLSKITKCIIAEVNHILDNKMTDYIEIYPFVPVLEMPKHYSSAKCCVLASLIEGKNRAITEAMACGTPVVLFKQHNQWARGKYPIFPQGSGELAEEFTPEALADAIHKVINNPQNYNARRNYLKYNGRTNFVNTCINYIPYYKKIIPELEYGRFHDNIWVNLATQDNYQMCFHSFLYQKQHNLNWVQKLENIDFLIKYYYSLFGIKE